MKTNHGYTKSTLTFILVGLATVTRCQAVGLDDLVEADSLERVATGFRFTEGPVWHPDGYLLFSDIPANTIYKWKPGDTVEVFRSPSGYSNGLTFDRQGRLIACEHSNRRVSRTDPDGTVVILADEYNGRRLNSPNDAVVKSDGSIYFTDPPIGLTAEYGVPGIQELPLQGVYRIVPDGETLELLAGDIYQPNGLAFSPDEKVLYVTDSAAGTIYAFDVQADGLLANKRVFQRLSGWPDGVKVDVVGNVYVTTNTSAIQIYNNAGNYRGSIIVPERTENCVFGGRDNKTLFITGGTSVYRLQMKVQGSPAVSSPDFNGDGIVDSRDVSIMVDHWHTDSELYDIAPPPFGDGFIDVQDLVALSEHLFEDYRTVAHWMLDETEGLTAYESLGVHDGYVVGNPVWLPEGGQVGGAIELDGVDDYVGTPFVRNPGEGSFSIFAWIQGGAPGQVVVSQLGGVNWLATDALSGALRTGLQGRSRLSGPLLSESVVADGQWHHVGITWDGSIRSLYVDDLLVAEDPDSALIPCQGGLNIGCGALLEPDTFFAGRIDDVVVYNRAITP